VCACVVRGGGERERERDRGREDASRCRDGRYGLCSVSIKNLSLYNVSLALPPSVCVCARACVCACVCARARVCVCVCANVKESVSQT
jgi:hypothetical protein